jgi:hypothetical protein
MVELHGFGRVRVAAAGLVVVSGLLAGTGPAAAECDPLLVSHWKLDGSYGTVAVDAVTHRRGTLENGAAFGPGRVNNGAVLDGVDDDVSGPVRVRTDTSFTVAAWVNLREIPDPGSQRQVIRTAVSIDGDRAGRFRLGMIIGRSDPLGAWMFELPESDTDGAQVTKRAVVPLDEVDTWVHLTGVYDAPNGRIWLYFNGTRLGDGTADMPWQATGGIRIGAGKRNGAVADFWPGGVDDVRVYRTALDAAAVSALYQSFPPSGGQPVGVGAAEHQAG